MGTCYLTFLMVRKNQIKRGDWIFTWLIKPEYNQVKVNLTSLTKAKGGEHIPFFSKYRPQIKFYSFDNSGITQYVGEVLVVSFCLLI